MFYFGTNTKQQLNQELHEEVVEIASLLAKSNKEAQLFVLPTMPLIVPLKKMSFGTGLWVGPQQISASNENTTGEISANLIKEIDADLVMVGHAERRALGENEKELADQIKNCQENDLKIIYCMGEKEKDVSKNASSSYIEESFQVINEVLKELGLDTKNYPLCYGGSVNVENAKEIASLDLCDGIFVGRSAWSKDGFRNVFEKSFAGYKSKQDSNH